jgi:hypothetical protein
MFVEPQVPEEWSDAEQWAWGEIKAGHIANFHKRYNKYLDPKNPEGWDDEQKNRRLSPTFLVTILAEESFRSVTLLKGVRIKGACFEEKIDLQHVRFERQLHLERCRFHDTLCLENLHLNGLFSLGGSWVGGALILIGSVFDSHVILKQVKICRQVDCILPKLVASSP